MSDNPLYQSTGPTDSPPPIISVQVGNTPSGTQCVLQFTAQDSGWYVYRMTITSTVEGTAYVYVGNSNAALDMSTVVSGSLSAEFDENDAVNPYYVPQGQTLTVVFVSGGECTARIEYNI